MTRYNLTINLVAGYETAEEARLVGQAVERLVGDSKHGSVKVTQVPEGREIPLVLPSYDRSKVIAGGQEAESTSLAILQEIQKAEPDVSTSSIIEEDEKLFVSQSKQSGQVDYPMLAALITSKYPTLDPEQLIAEAVGRVNARSVLRLLQANKMAMVKKNRKSHS